MWWYIYMYVLLLLLFQYNEALSDVMLILIYHINIY